MKTTFTSEDLKNIIDSAFNGNLGAYKASKGAIPYENPTSENVALIDDNGVETQVDLAEYLNVEFYCWKNRVSEEERDTMFGHWLDSLNYSLNKAYALVEFLDEKAVASEDIDSATASGMVTFLVQTDKIKNFDYYWRKVRNAFLGVPQEIVNAYGEKLTALLSLGLPRMLEEPMMTQVGECIVATAQFSLTYINQANSYSDFTYELSLDGTTYKPLAITSMTWQEVFQPTAVPRANRPDLNGYVNQGKSSTKTIGYFEFRSGESIAPLLTKKFLEMSALEISGVATTRKSVNIPVWFRVTDKADNTTYLYKDVITEMERKIVNNDFVVASLTVRGWGMKE